MVRLLRELLDEVKPRREKLLKVEDIAEYLQVAPHTIHTWVSEQRIPHIKLGGRCTRFDLEKVKKWLATMEQKGRRTRRVPVK